MQCIFPWDEKLPFRCQLIFFLKKGLKSTHACSLASVNYAYHLFLYLLASNLLSHRKRDMNAYPPCIQLLTISNILFLVRRIDLLLLSSVRLSFWQVITINKTAGFPLSVCLGHVDTTINRIWHIFTYHDGFFISRCTVSCKFVQFRRSLFRWPLPNSNTIPYWFAVATCGFDL